MVNPLYFYGPTDNRKKSIGKIRMFNKGGKIKLEPIEAAKQGKRYIKSKTLISPTSTYLQ